MTETGPEQPTSETAAEGDVSQDVVAAIDTLMRKGNVPGLSLAVVDANGLRFAGGFGTADFDSGVKPRPSTQYLWFSMSKIVTATAAMALADEGRLDLDAPIKEYASYLEAPGAIQPSTRQLRSQTSGLRNPIPIRWAHLATDEAPDAAALLQRQMSRRRADRYPVGEAARYSNLGYLAAGAVISAASGEPFTKYVQQSVLSPAGMRRTGYTYQPDGDAATGYARVPRIVTPVLRAALPSGVIGARHGRYLALKRFYVDGPSYGGLVGDVLDAGRFLRLHLNNGSLDGHRVLSEQSARAMRVLDQPGKPFDHGIGWFRRPSVGPGDWVEHFGSGVGFWNVMRLYPERGLGVVVMSNSTTTYDFEPLFALITDHCR
ncbi:MAG: serine hydrolase domain-containing protein [Actinomycetes bacterium]